MARDDALLRVPEAIFLRDGDYLVQFVHVQVAAGAVVVFEERAHGFVPPLQHPPLPRIGGVEVDARLGAPDGRPGHRKFHLHGFGQRFYLVAVQALAHAGASASRPAAKRVDNRPSFSLGLGVFPLEDNLRALFLERFK